MLAQSGVALPALSVTRTALRYTCDVDLARRGTPAPIICASRDASEHALPVRLRGEDCAERGAVCQPAETVRVLDGQQERPGVLRGPACRGLSREDIG